MLQAKRGGRLTPSLLHKVLGQDAVDKFTAMANIK
jgi:hypothetical protein